MTDLRILYVGNFSKFSVGEPEIADALESFGHEVTRLDARQTSVDGVRIRALDHDLLLFSKFNINPVTDAREFIRNCPIPTVCWMFDLYWGYHRAPRINTEPHFGADLVCTTDGGHAKKWEEAGINHHCIRQGIEKGVKRGKKDSLGPVEIGFIGTINTWSGWEYRQRLVEWLKTTYGERFCHYGQHGNVRHEELNNLLASLKITIGDTVHSPYYWSNRVYEMTGRGAFLIHPKVDGLEKEFKYYKHFVPYRFGDFEGLKGKIDYFLEHDEEREAIRQAGYEHCHKHHTYTHRVQQLLNIIENEDILHRS